MGEDGITTIQEMMAALNNAMDKCSRYLLLDLPPKDKDGNYYQIYCKGEWDHISCWPHSPPGESVSIPCPGYTDDFDHTGNAHRHCSQDGTWATVRHGNQTWTDYSACRYPEEDDIVQQIKTGDPKTKSLIVLYTVGYSFSLVALIVAMAILGYFKRLHCTRNYIHMHLFVSFIFRALVIFLKDHVLYDGAGILDVLNQVGNGNIETLERQLQKYSSEESSYYIGCKLVVTLFHYFVATNYYWILVEALYLHSLIFVAFFSEKKYLWRFTLTGWGVPILFVIPWAIVRSTLEDTSCWDISASQYKWIYNGPIVVANVINFLLFLNIVRVLWYKMKERGSISRTDSRRQYKKLAKSTLVLIPMFGVHAIVFVGMPESIKNGIWWDIRMYFDLFFNSFQGFFVAIIYCFCNGEVQAEFRKAWERFNLSVEIQKDRRERSRSSVTLLTSFNSSASQQARLSIGGQSNNRHGHHRTTGNSMLLSKSHSSADHRNSCSKQESFTQRKSDGESSFFSTPGGNWNNNSNVKVSEELALNNLSPSIIRTQSPIVESDYNLPTTEKKELEEAFEIAVEENIDCPAQSFALADEKNNLEIHVETCNKSDDSCEVSDHDASTHLHEKDMNVSLRTCSKDSGVSSTSTLYNSLRGSDTNPLTSDLYTTTGCDGDVYSNDSHKGEEENFLSKT